MKLLAQSGNTRIIQNDEGRLASQTGIGNKWCYDYNGRGQAITFPFTQTGLEACEEQSGFWVNMSLNRLLELFEDQKQQPEKPRIPVSQQAIKDLAHLVFVKKHSQIYITIDNAGEFHPMSFYGRSDFVLTPQFIVLLELEDKSEESIFYAIQMMVYNRPELQLVP